MTVEAILRDGGMLEQKRTALFRVALITGFIDGIRFKQIFRGTAVGIVAIDATDLAFKQGHVGAPEKLGTLFLVAHETGFIDAFSCQQSGIGEFRHRVMAIGTGDVMPFVH